MNQPEEFFQVVRGPGVTHLDNRIFLLHLPAQSVAIYCLCMSSVSYKKRLDSVEKLASHLLMTTEDAMIALDALTHRGLASINESGDFTVYESPQKQQRGRNERS